MKSKTFKMLLAMQVFYVIFGIGLYYGLKHMRMAHKAEKALECEFAHWLGAPVEESRLKQTGRPYIILPPRLNVRMNVDSTRINVRTDDAGVVTEIRCG